MLLSAKIAKLETLKKQLTFNMEEIQAAKACEVPENFQAVLQDTLLGFDLKLNHISYLAVLGQNEQRIAKELADIDNTLNALETVLEDAEKPAAPTANRTIICDPEIINEKRISGTTCEGSPISFIIKRAYIDGSLLIVVSDGGRECSVQFSLKDGSKDFTNYLRKFGFMRA